MKKLLGLAGSDLLVLRILLLLILMLEGSTRSDCLVCAGLAADEDSAVVHAVWQEGAIALASAQVVAHEFGVGCAGFDWGMPLLIR